MGDSEETLKAEPTLNNVMGVLDKINKRFDGIESRFDGYDAQFEAIRSGIVANSAAFDRLTAKVLLLGADVKELGEIVRKKELV